MFTPSCSAPLHVRVRSQWFFRYVFPVVLGLLLIAAGALIDTYTDLSLISRETGISFFGFAVMVSASIPRESAVPVWILVRPRVSCVLTSWCVLLGGKTDFADMRTTLCSRWYCTIRWSCAPETQNLTECKSSVSSRPFGLQCSLTDAPAPAVWCRLLHMGDLAASSPVCRQVLHPADARP